MIQNQSRSSQRSAFTMVELMVVILIIAILVSLISGAVIKAMQKIPETQTRTEIAEMDVALKAFMSDYGLSEPPPSLLLLNETSPLSVGGPSAQFLQKAFGKNLTSTDWNGDGVIQPANVTWTLQGFQCLVFYLGGIPNMTAVASGMPPGPQGFSTNNMKPSYGSMPQAPYNETMGKRKGPYFTFQTARLLPTPPVNVSGGFFLYVDPWQTKNGPFYSTFGGTPYAFFSCYGINNGYSFADCAGLSYNDALGAHSALPYYQGTTGTALSYTFSNTWQIISAGKDGMFGYNPSLYGTAPNPNLWSPTSGAPANGKDDQANFSASLLGSGQS